MANANGSETENYYEAYIIEDETPQDKAASGKKPEAAFKRPSLVACVLQIVAGALLILIGLPLLILPGPGLLVIAAGAALAASALKRLFFPLARSAAR